MTSSLNQPSNSSSTHAASPQGSHRWTPTTAVAESGEIMQNRILWRLRVSHLWPLRQVSKSFERDVLQTGMLQHKEWECALGLPHGGVGLV
ncbi:hypothetical protein M427DRAFT_57945, partial [Gonapodya prolifera JEL478]